MHGAVWQEIATSESVIQAEINSAADNPLVFAAERQLLSCGNFHAVYVARALDQLTSAMATLASISERRVNLAMDPQRSRLPEFLVADGGLQSGFMMAQTTAAALASECRSLSFPASVESIPTNNDQEDHVSMGPNAGFKALAVVEKLRHVLAIELLTAAQAIDLQAPHRPAKAIGRLHQLIREDIPPLTDDRVLSGDIETVAQRIHEGVYT